MFVMFSIKVLVDGDLGLFSLKELLCFVAVRGCT